MGGSGWKRGVGGTAGTRTQDQSLKRALLSQPGTNKPRGGLLPVARAVGGDLHPKFGYDARLQMGR